MQRLYTEHYGKLLSFAKIALAGPRGVSVGDEFWGGHTLSLFSMRLPMIEGVIESRIVYSNLADTDQNDCILRWATWDAELARRTLREDSKLGREPSIALPEVHVYSVWVNVSWLKEAIERLQALTVPLVYEESDDYTTPLYRLRLERVDTTLIDVRWKANGGGAFVSLTDEWQRLWRQMDQHLRQNNESIYSEDWDVAHRLLFPTHTYRYKALST
jgi:hypothetical protein